jgi:hypothetical protein
MKNYKKIIFIFILITIAECKNAKAQNVTAMYVNHIEDIFTTGSTGTLFNYALDNNINYFALNELHLLTTTSGHFSAASKAYLNSFITTAHSYGIAVGAVGENYNFFNDRIVYYNTFQTSTVDQRFDALNLEFEFWNQGTITAQYCTPYLSANNSCVNGQPYPCTPAGAWTYLSECCGSGSSRLSQMHNLASVNGMLFEMYITSHQDDVSMAGYLSSCVPFIAKNVDRILLETYHSSDLNVYYDGTTGPTSRKLLMAIGAVTSRNVNILPIFSSEASPCVNYSGNFIKNWSIKRPYDTFLNGTTNSSGALKDFATDVFPGKSFIIIGGYMWFKYSEMSAQIKLNGAVLNVSNGPVSTCKNTKLYANSAGDIYSWSTGTTSESITLNTSATSNYSVSVTNHYSAVLLGSCLHNSSLSNSYTITVTTSTAATVSINSLSASYCKGTSAITLSGTPSGGTFTIDGITATQLNPATLTLGPHTVIYLYTSGGCTTSDIKTVNITAPYAYINGLNSTYPTTASPIILSGIPSGGTFKIDGTTTTTFSPGSLSIGNHTVEYIYTSGACVNNVLKTVGIYALPAAPIVSGATIYKCQKVTLSGSVGTGGTTINWYNALTGGTLLATGLSYTTGNLSATTTYYVTSAECGTGLESSPRTAVTVTVIDEPNDLIFDGVDDRCKVPHISSYNLGTNSFTIEARIHLNSLSPITYPMIFSRRIINGGGIIFGIWNTGVDKGRLFAQIGGASPNYINTSGPFVNDGDCHNVALKRSGNTFTFFVDGTSYTGFTSTNSLTTSSATDLYFGIDPPNVSQTPFKGDLDEIRFWNIARNDLDIAGYMDCSLMGNESGLLGYWPFSEGTGQTINDFSPTLNDGFLGIDGTTTYDPVWASACGAPRLAFAEQQGNEILPDSLRMSNKNFSIYPNPAHDKITVSIDVKENSNFTIQMSDVSGRAILSENNSAVSGLNIYELNLSHLSKGIYIMEVIAANESWKTKVVVE